jgi:hypothetical protein
MKILILLLALVIPVQGQVVVSLQPIPMKLAKANLGKVVDGFGLWRVIACNQYSVSAEVQSSRLAFEAFEVGLVPRSMVLNAVNRGESKSFNFFATNVLRIGGSGLTTAIASNAINISARSSGLIFGAGLAAFELLGSFNKKQTVFDFSTVLDGSMVVPAGKCGECLAFAKLQKKVRPHRVVINLESIENVKPPEIKLPIGFTVTSYDSGLTAIPENLKFLDEVIL